jgi:protein transport protein SEC31
MWGSHGMGEEEGEGEHPMGIIVGGCDNGVMEVYDAAKILKKGESESPLILSKNKHTGPVRALDFNPFRVRKMKN